MPWATGLRLKRLRLVSIPSDHGENSSPLQCPVKGRPIHYYWSAWGYDLERLTRQPPAVRFQAERSDECWHFDLSPSDFKHLSASRLNIRPPGIRSTVSTIKLALDAIAGYSARIGARVVGVSASRDMLCRDWIVGNSNVHFSSQSLAGCVCLIESEYALLSSWSPGATSLVRGTFLHIIGLRMGRGRGKSQAECIAVLKIVNTFCTIFRKAL